jgi:hypothetical protein
MRRPGVLFWRRTLIASAVVLVASVAVTLIACVRLGSLRLTPRIAITYGLGHLGISRFAKPGNLDVYLRNWTSQWTPFDGLDWRPFLWNGQKAQQVTVPAQYLCVPPLLTAIASGLVLVRRRNQTSAPCAACGYSLAGLPVDVTACPECGGKIDLSHSR